MTKKSVKGAFGHCKFIGFGAHAPVLFAEARVPPTLDEGFIPIAKPADAETFVNACRSVRFWPRELTVDLDAASLTPT